MITEPSVVAVNQKQGVWLRSEQTQTNAGPHPGHITAIRPLVDGVISDFEITEEMLAYLMNRVKNIQ